MKKTKSSRRKIVADELERVQIAIGLSALALEQTREAVEKDMLTLRVHALDLLDRMRRIHAMRRSLLGALKEARVVPRTWKGVRRPKG